MECRRREEGRGRERRKEDNWVGKGRKVKGCDQ